jgi:hypothetical protein
MLWHEANVLKLRDIVQPNVKAAEDCRSPGRYRVCRDRTKLRQLFGLRQPSGALQWKSGRGLPQSKTLRVRGGAGNCASFLDCASPLALCNGKAAEDCRSPRRFAFEGAPEIAPAFWTAPALWRFAMEKRQKTAAVQDAIAFAGTEQNCASFWTAPVTWRYAVQDDKRVFV